MEPQTASASSPRDPLSGTASLILGDGAAAGLVFISRSLLRQICGQTNANSSFTTTEDVGLLLGPEPQTDDVLVEAALRLGSEYRSARSLESLLAGVQSVQPVLAEAQQKRSLGIVGLYRIALSGQEKVSSTGFEFLTANGHDNSALSTVRCGFVIVPVSEAEVSIRVLMRKGEQWTEIQQIKLQEPVSPSVTTSTPALALLEPALAKLEPVISRLRNLAEWAREGKAASTLASIRAGHRFWLGAAMTLLVASLAANVVMVWYVRHVPRQSVIVNSQPPPTQIAERKIAVSKPSVLPPAPALTVVTRDVPPAAPAFAVATRDVPAATRDFPAAAPDIPNVPITKPQPLKTNSPEKRVSTAPTPAGRLAIARKPAILKPADAFQFKVSGDPAPEVRWSSEGPGAIDPVYGLYRAPSQFKGEASVRITAKSRTQTGSVTFTLKGMSTP